jgi:hypothetical protein
MNRYPPHLPRGFLPAAPPDQPSAKHYRKQLATWANTPSHPAATEHRHVELAVKRIHAWLTKENPFERLDLSELGLRVVPPLPEGVTVLDLSMNAITDVPATWPDTLRSLTLAVNQLSSLATRFPDSLEHLDASFNLLRDLPENLPHRLLTLDASRNGLMTVPENLPVSLTQIDLRGNLIDIVPATLFLLRAACEINLDDNPPELRTYVKHLLQWASNGDTPRFKLPRAADETMSACEENAAHPAASNRLLHAASEKRDIAARREQAGTPLLATERSRQFTTMPQAAKTLPHAAQAARTTSTWTTSASTSTSAFTASTSKPARAARQLKAAIAKWDMPVTIRIADAVQHELNASKFAAFLDQLRTTLCYKDPAFRDSVAEMLVQIAADPALRQRVFNEAGKAADWTPWRLVQTYNRVKRACIERDMENGLFGFRLDELVNIARRLLRSGLIYFGAVEKSTALARRDVIITAEELQVEYELKLNTALDLGLEVASIRYATGHLGEADFAAMSSRVKSKENRLFDRFIAIEEAPWIAVFKRRDARFAQAIEESFAASQGAALTSGRRKLHAKLIADFLAQAGHADLLAPAWKSV